MLSVLFASLETISTFFQNTGSSLCQLSINRCNIFSFSHYFGIQIKAVWAAVWGWMMMGIVANQNTIHHKDDDGNFAMTIILGFPVHGVIF